MRTLLCCLVVATLRLRASSTITRIPCGWAALARLLREARIHRDAAYWCARIAAVGLVRTKPRQPVPAAHEVVRRIPALQYKQRGVARADRQDPQAIPRRSERPLPEPARGRGRRHRENVVHPVSQQVLLHRNHPFQDPDWVYQGVARYLGRLGNQIHLLNRRFCRVSSLRPSRPFPARRRDRTMPFSLSFFLGTSRWHSFFFFL